MIYQQIIANSPSKPAINQGAIFLSVLINQWLIDDQQVINQRHGQDPYQRKLQEFHRPEIAKADIFWHAYHEIPNLWTWLDDGLYLDILWLVDKSICPFQRISTPSNIVNIPRKRNIHLMPSLQNTVYLNHLVVPKCLWALVRYGWIMKFKKKF